MYFNESPSEAGYGEAIEAIGLGVAIFQTGQSILTSGDFSTESSTVNYIHEHTPASRPWSRCTKEFSLKAKRDTNPVRDWVFGNETFWFTLSFEYNGNDIRNAAIMGLVSRSSSLYSSTFTIRFVGQQYSVPRAPVAEVLFQISGRWNPVGRGDVSFSGELLLKADGTVTLRNFTSERNWVWVGQPPTSCSRVAPWTPPAPIVPTRMPVVRTVYFQPGSDRIVEDDERRLMAWFRTFGPVTKASIARGDSPVQVEGFASTTQGGPANLRLSRRRAERVAQLIRDALGSNTAVNVFARGEYQARTSDRVEAASERRAVITINLLMSPSPASGVQGYGEYEGLPCLYGRWCGPGCSGPGAPIDELDQCCKSHDECYGRRGYFNCGCDRDVVNCVAPLRSRPGAMGTWATRVHRYFSNSPCRG